MALEGRALIAGMLPLRFDLATAVGISPDRWVARPRAVIIGADFASPC
jgi:hypothetical protein